MQLQLIKTCSACPEQYDAFYNGKKIGYLQLRYGLFRAEFEDVVIYNAYPQGDGTFEDGERNRYLTEACDMIIKAYINKYESSLDEPNYIIVRKI